MGSLQDFDLRIKDMIERKNFNVSVSGVALIVNEAQQTLYSASLIHNSEGVVPVPDAKNLNAFKSVMQRAQVCGYSLRYVQFVSALFKDEKLLRWQAQYDESSVE